ncbi:MAG TPA: zf-HC2 domain-containing protein [Syntrophomonadaceae bacterium]|jgi:hypothetical protein|nr:zf-HC2 domain-containing protein [Syntrophomonadaceae bacterium]
MDCRKIEQLISPYVDGELTRAETDMVRAHLSACADCQQEYEDFVLISSVMKSVSHEVVPAPTGFSTAVMKRIQEEEEKVLPLTRKTSWWGRNWKQTVAGIAAAAVLMMSTTLMNGIGPLVQIADNPPSILQPDNLPGGDNLVNDPGIDPGNNVNIDPGKNPGGDPTTNPNVDPGIDSQTNPDNGQVQIAQNPDPSEYSPVVFLNKERFLVSTLLEIKAGDADRAQQQILSLAGQYQAQVQNLGQQVNDNGRHTVLKVTIAKSQAGKLMAGVEKLGHILDKEVSRTDINLQFASKLSQYQNLVAQRNDKLDPDDVAALDARITSLENELKTWDQQADQETIILWLLK